MKKYLGIVKLEKNYMGGLHISLLTKTYDNELTLNDWFLLYPGCEHVILENTEELDAMFEIFHDPIPITDEEKKQDIENKKIYKKFLKD